MEPIVHGLEEQYGNEIEFVYVDVDDPTTQAIKEQLGYRVQPHFFLIDENGEIISQWLGSVDGMVFEEAFKDVLN